MADAATGGLAAGEAAQFAESRARQTIRERRPGRGGECGLMCRLARLQGGPTRRARKPPRLAPTESFR
eukprot:2565178-Alexandrium_andersonii.AAC.1